MSEQLLGRWVRLERDRLGSGGDSPLGDGERAELARLRKEVRELRLDREFLSKATAFFAAEQRRK